MHVYIAHRQCNVYTAHRQCNVYIAHRQCNVYTAHCQCNAAQQSVSALAVLHLHVEYIL
jgi:hypothetical protein